MVAVVHQIARLLMVLATPDLLRFRPLDRGARLTVEDLLNVWRRLFFAIGVLDLALPADLALLENHRMRLLARLWLALEEVLYRPHDARRACCWLATQRADCVTRLACELRGGWCRGGDRLKGPATSLFWCTIAANVALCRNDLLRDEASTRVAQEIAERRLLDLLSACGTDAVDFARAVAGAWMRRSCLS